MISIHPDKIKVVIGRGGETINSQNNDETALKSISTKKVTYQIASTDAFRDDSTQKKSSKI